MKRSIFIYLFECLSVLNAKITNFHQRFVSKVDKTWYQNIKKILLKIILFNPKLIGNPRETDVGETTDNH